MPASQQIDLFGFVASSLIITGVGAVVSRVVEPPRKSLMTRTEATEGHHSIPWGDKKRLTEQYGKWAVNMA